VALDESLDGLHEISTPISVARDPFSVSVLLGG
jgi:hypothetical protein